jgi:hypothetical protein
MCGDPMKFMVLHSEIEIALLKYYKSQKMNPQGILNKRMEIFALKYIKKLTEYENFGEII